MSAVAKDVSANTESKGDAVLTLPRETVTNLATINKAEAWLKEIEDVYKVVPDVETKEGMDLARTRRRELISARTNGDQARKDATKPLRDETKRINDLWNTNYQPRIEALEKPIDKAIKDVEEREERLKREKAEADQLRIDGIQTMINDIKAAPASAVSIDQIDSALKLVNGFDMNRFDEFVEAAQLHISNAVDTLTLRKDQLSEQAEQKRQQEAEATRLAEQKREQDEQAASLQKQQHDIAEQQRKIDEANEAQAGRDAETKAEFEKKDSARIADLKSGIDEIKDAPERLQTIDAISIYLDELGDANANDFDEFKDIAGHAIANAQMALVEKRRQLLKKAEADKQAEEDERLADIEAARQQGIKEAAEAERIKKAKAKAAKEKAAQLKALQPDVEKLRAYVAELLNVQTPTLKSNEALNALQIISDQLHDMSGLADLLPESKAA